MLPLGAFASAAASLGSRLSAAAAAIDAGRDQFLRERSLRDGARFAESPATPPLPAGPSDVSPAAEGLSPPPSPIQPDSNTPTAAAAASLASLFHGLTSSIASAANKLAPSPSTPYQPTSLSSLEPWSNAPDPIALRNDILDLSKDKRNFLTPPPAESDFVFCMDDYHKMALHLLNIESNLQKMRFELVPRKIKDEEFWRNYFYRVQILRQHAMLAGPPVNDDKNKLATPRDGPRGSPNTVVAGVALGGVGESRQEGDGVAVSDAAVSIKHDDASGSRDDDGSTQIRDGVESLTPVASAFSIVATSSAAVDTITASRTSAKDSSGVTTSIDKSEMDTDDIELDLDLDGDGDGDGDGDYTSDWETQLQAELIDL